MSPETPHLGAPWGSLQHLITSHSLENPWYYWRINCLLSSRSSVRIRQGASVTARLLSQTPPASRRVFCWRDHFLWQQGHAWIRQQWVQPAGFPVSGQPVRFFCEDTASSTVYIGSNVANNPHLDFEETRRQIEIAAGCRDIGFLS